MPVFVMIGRDGPDGVRLRSEFHDEHVAHVTALHAAGRVVLAGPIRSDDNNRSIGAVIVFEAPTLDDARRTVADDPYVRGGVFESVTLNPYKPVFSQNP